MPKVHLEHLTPTEQQAVLEFVHLLQERFNGRVRSALLFGSKARGEGSPDSDLDVLVVIDSDDWRVHKQIRYLAADICLKYDLNLSPRVWSTSHRREMEELQTLLYQNIRRDGVNLLALSPAAG
jgi:predicted nucleotidyltransferase